MNQRARDVIHVRQPPSRVVPRRKRAMGVGPVVLCSADSSPYSVLGAETQTVRSPNGVATEAHRFRSPARTHLEVG